MSRKKKHEEHLNHEAWAIPYGDLLTLLLAFFVVMYAISSVDAGKYRVLSNSLIEAFGSPSKVNPIEIGDPNSTENILDEGVRKSLSPVEVEQRVAEFWKTGSQPPAETEVEPEELLAEGSPANQPTREKLLVAIADIADEIESALGTLIREQTIRVRREAYWLEIEINTNLLFSSGSAVIEKSAQPVLVELAHILSGRGVRLHVEGHTDNVPISTAVYPSNWELAAGRAASVVHLFADHGVDPRRMVAMSYGEYQPVASNASAEGRARNRRVAIVILPSVLPRTKQSVDPERLKGEHPEFEELPSPEALQQQQQRDVQPPSSPAADAGAASPR